MMANNPVLPGAAVSGMGSVRKQGFLLIIRGHGLAYAAPDPASFLIRHPPVAPGMQSISGE